MTTGYDDDDEAYVATFDTAGLEPGYFEVKIDLPDGSSLSQVIQIKGETE